MVGSRWSSVARGAVASRPVAREGWMARGRLRPLVVSVEPPYGGRAAGAGGVCVRPEGCGEGSRLQRERIARAVSRVRPPPMLSCRRSAGAVTFPTLAECGSVFNSTLVLRQRSTAVLATLEPRSRGWLIRSGAAALAPCSPAAPACWVTCVLWRAIADFLAPPGAGSRATRPRARAVTHARNIFGSAISFFRGSSIPCQWLSISSWALWYLVGRMACIVLRTRRTHSVEVIHGD